MANEARSRKDVSKSTIFFLAAVGIHVLLLLFILLFCDVKYEVSDDFVMEQILSGAYTGKPDAHIMFSNILWGAFLRLFYSFLPGISWYFWSQILVCLISVLAITFVLSHELPTPGFLLLSTAFFGFSAKDMFLLVQFTKTATVAIAAGGLLFLWASFEGKGRGIRFFGAVLFLTGTLIRFHSLFVALPFLFLYFLHKAFVKSRYRSQGFSSSCGRFLILCACLLLAAFAFRLLDDAAYQADERYSQFRLYSAARAKLVDYPLPDYSACADQLSAIGISENDYALLSNWGFADDSVFSLKTLEQIVHVIEEYRSQHLPSLRKILHEMIARRYFFYPGAINCLLIGLLYLACSRRRLWIPFASLFFILCILTFFIAMGRCVYRVEFGLFFCAALVCTVGLASPNTADVPSPLRASFPHASSLDASSPLRASSRFRASGELLLSLLLFGLLLPSYLPDFSYRSLTQEEYRDYVDSTFYFSWDYSPEKYTKVISRRPIHGDFLRYVRENPTSLFLLDFNTTIQTLYYDFSPFQSLPKGSLHNLLYLGGVTVHHPALSEAMASWGFGDMLPALLQENVYFVSNVTDDIVLEYLRSHYNPRVEKKQIATLDGYHIWSYEVSP